MSTSTAYASSLIAHILAGNVYGALHTNDPGAAGNQTTNEVAYTGYARRPIALEDWDIEANTFTNAAAIEFAEATAVPGAQSASHFTIGTAANGAGVVMLRGRLQTPQPIAVGTELRFRAGTMVGTVDTSAPA